MKSKITYIACLLFFMASCSKEEQSCYVPKSVFVQVGFYVVDSVRYTVSQGRDSIVVQIRDTSMRYPSLLSLNVPNPVKFQGDRSVFYMEAMLNPATQRMQYLFKPDSTQQQFDTLTFFYTPKHHFISNACGYTYYYRLDSFRTTKNVVDSFYIKNAEVTLNAQQKHLQLYFFKQ